MLRQNRSTKMLSNARPRPSMLMTMLSHLSAPLNASLVNWAPCIFLVNQATEQQVVLINRLGLSLRVDRGAGHACQSALPNQGHGRSFVDPRLPCHDRLVLDFF
jgi:hypothetical protein